MRIILDLGQERTQETRRKKDKIGNGIIKNVEKLAEFIQLMLLFTFYFAGRLSLLSF